VSLPKQQHITTLTLLLLTVVSCGADVSLKQGTFRLGETVQLRIAKQYIPQEDAFQLQLEVVDEDKELISGSGAFQVFFSTINQVNSIENQWSESSLTKLASRKELSSSHFSGYKLKFLRIPAEQSQLTPPLS